MAVKLISMTLNFRRRIVVQLEILQSGSNSVNARRDTSDNSASHAPLDTVIAQQTAVHSCLAFPATATSMLKSVTPKRVVASANTTQPATTAISAHEVSMATLWEVLPTIVRDARVLTTALACSFLMNQSSAWNVRSDTSVSGNEVSLIERFKMIFLSQVHVARFVLMDTSVTRPVLLERFSSVSHAIAMETQIRMLLETATERLASA